MASAPVKVECIPSMFIIGEKDEGNTHISYMWAIVLTHQVPIHITQYLFGVLCDQKFVVIGYQYL